MLTPDALDKLIRQSLDHRDSVAQCLVQARGLVKALKQAASVSRTRGRFRKSRLSSQSLALAAHAVGLDVLHLSLKTGISIERLADLQTGAVPTDTERAALLALLPTWQPPTVQL